MRDELMEHHGVEIRQMQAEAVYRVLGWLTTRESAVTFSSVHNAAVVADLADEFCRANGLGDPDMDTSKLVHPGRPVRDGGMMNTGIGQDPQKVTPDVQGKSDLDYLYDDIADEARRAGFDTRGIVGMALVRTMADEIIVLKACEIERERKLRCELLDAPHEPTAMGGEGTCDGPTMYADSDAPMGSMPDEHDAPPLVKRSVADIDEAARRAAMEGVPNIEVPKARLGLATTGEILQELHARISMSSDGLDYTTVGSH